MAYPHLAEEPTVDVRSAVHRCDVPPAFVEVASSGGLPGWREAGSGRPLLLLHGWSLSGQAFDGQRALARHGYRVIAPDHAGHGLSARLRPAGATISDLAEDAAALVRHLKLDDVVVVGWSMGAMVAWELMRSLPGLPITLVGSLDMTPRLVTDAGWPYGLHGHYDAAHAGQMAIRIRQHWESLMVPVAAGLWASGAAPSSEQACAVARMMRQCSPDTLAALWQDMARQDFRAVLQAARWPLFHLYGERSRLYAPAVGRATLALQPAARFATIPGTGHAPHLERPDATNAVLLHMLRSHENAR
ncbi:MAG: alpha/beta hydrolase [Burkholderiaceae bacterium]|jgi:pimeloyl-ACP methyl ester carboxylesterase|nr:alpha/beta hydrolase [Burkholderiaceae bacterium]